MSSNRELIIAIPINTTLDRISQWLYDYPTKQFTNFGSINETNFQLSLVYFMKTPVSTQSRVIYHVVACPLDKLERVRPDYCNEPEFDSSFIKIHENLLGVFILETQEHDKVFLIGLREDDLNIRVWEHIFNKIVFNFSPENLNIPIIDEKVISSEQFKEMGLIEPGPTGTADIDDKNSQEKIDKCKKVELPKTKKTLIEYSEAYEVIQETRREYLSEYKSGNTKNPEPDIDDFYIQLIDKLNYKRCDKTIKKIIKLGDAGYLEM